ncbi:MAG: phosphorylating glyceraldehyde-3-phosphate dehydrogenase [Candidatus Methanofastidiosia archaeon]
MKIFINGYGTIGKRVADAVLLQKDMELLGVSKRKPDFEARMALEKGFRLFTLRENLSSFKARGYNAEEISKGISESDVVIDCTPKNMGAVNKKLYERLSKRAIFQGGEKADIGQSFVAQCNFEAAFSKKYLRVVSCNTTGLARSLSALQTHVKRVNAVMIRRSADPHDIRKGPINAIVPETKVPSHHGPDVRTILPIEIQTIALKIPTTLMHLHVISVELKDKILQDEVIDIFKKTTRIRLVSSKEGFTSTAHLMELARDLQRGRSDMYEICIWEDSVNIKKDTLYYLQAVHQESDVVPENIDAVRAMFELMSKWESIRLTNESLGIP